MKNFETEITEAIESASERAQVAALNKLKEQYSEANAESREFFRLVAIASRISNEFYNTVYDFREEPNREKLAELLRCGTEMVETQEKLDKLKD